MMCTCVSVLDFFRYTLLSRKYALKLETIPSWMRKKAADSGSNQIAKRQAAGNTVLDFCQKTRKRHSLGMHISPCIFEIGRVKFLVPLIFEL